MVGYFQRMKKAAYFDPKPTAHPFPKRTDGHYLDVDEIHDITFDKDYPYVPTSFSFRFKRFFIRCGLWLIVFPFSRAKIGLKIQGKKNLRKNKKLLKGGALSCSNHVHPWDYIAVTKAIRPKKPNVIVWAPNVRGGSGPLVRLVGGIPIPDTDFQATLAFHRSIEHLLENKGWLHFYPEGSMWEYYAPVRPFKKGMAHFACTCHKPIVPMAFSYRKPSKLRKRLFGQPACFTLRIGKPLMANEALPLQEQEEDLTKRCFEAVCRLAGIDPEENLYPPLFKNNERVDYYPFPEEEN